MSYDSRGAGVPYGATADASRDREPSRKGSVKAARQRVQEEQAQMGDDTFATPYYNSYAAPPGRLGRTNDLVSQFNTQHRPPVQQLQLQIPTPPSSRGSSRQPHSPEQHWPLSERQDDSPRQHVNDRPSPPQRPPRPSYVPSILDPTVQQNMLHASQRPGMPSMPGPPHQSPQRTQNADFLSPNVYVPLSEINRPRTTSSYASNSSTGSIPDFPVPSMPRKNPNIGPPPSARRGPSSYYSQAAYVSPIVEEAESNRSHNSFASSNVMPTHAEEYYSDDGTEVLDLSPTTDDDDGQASRKSDEADSAGLVRKASFGRRGKPSLTTIRSIEALNSNSRNNSVVGQAAVAAGAAGGAFAAGLGNSNARDGQRLSPRPDSQALAGGTGLLDPSTSSSSSNSSQESFSVFGKGKKNKVPSPLGRQSPSMTPNGPEVDRVLGGLEKGGMFASAQPIQKGNLADRVGARRPPRLNMDSVRDAEARGSLTSLPDLIRRATRLAGNLDRGKTASKLGLDFWEHGEHDEKHQQWEYQRRSGSLSDMLSSFPPPAVGTPSGGHTPYDRPISHWPSGRAMEQHYDDDQYPQKRSANQKKQGRRCCGMPLWCFITLTTTLAVLAIAAIVVPVCLIVLPSKGNSSSASNAKALAACQSSQACQNGGSSLVSPSGACSCLCTNGFTGGTCTTESDPSCTTTTVGSTSNATVGSSIPRVFQSSRNYSIPLDSTTLLSLFASNNLSCTSENALVTFNGLSSRSIAHKLQPVHLPLFQNTEDTSPPPTHSDLTPRAAQSSVGIIFDSISSTDTTTPSDSTTTSSTSSAPSSSSSATACNQLPFARLSVLFVLEQTAALDAAVAAQESLQTWLSDSAAERNGTEVGLGRGFTADMALCQVLMANGTSVGGIA